MFFNTELLDSLGSYAFPSPGDAHVVKNFICYSHKEFHQWLPPLPQGSSGLQLRKQADIPFALDAAAQRIWEGALQIPMPLLSPKLAAGDVWVLPWPNWINWWPINFGIVTLGAGEAQDGAVSFQGSKGQCLSRAP